MNLEGFSIDRYSVERLLGHGGMGDVYLAQDTTIHRQVAIKVIRSEMAPYPNSSSSRESAALSQREMKAIAHLDHPHILPLYDYGEKTVNGTPLAYLVMPYREEGSLAHWLHQRTSSTLLSLENVLFLMMQAADALQHAHDHEIVHQDVKPSNFLVRQRRDDPDHPDLFLADFGIAKFITTTSATSQNIRGTPTYMAPEQWLSKSVPQTDQYALAVMIYELLTGQAPFQGGMAQMMYQHLNVTPEAPGRIHAGLSSSIDEVLLKALEKRPEDRFPSMTSFIEALKQAILQGTNPQLRVRDARTVLPPGQPSHADALKAASVDTPEEEHLRKVSPTLFPGREEEENIATQPSQDLPTVISAKGPTLQPSDAFYAQSYPHVPPTQPVDSFPPPDPGNIRSQTASVPGRTQPTARPTSRRLTIAVLIVIAILVIAFGSAGILFNMRQAESDRSTSTAATVSAQNTASANQENITSTAQAMDQQQASNDATSTAIIQAQQTAQAQNNANATATAQAQNNANTTPTVVVIVATPTLPPPTPTPTPTPVPVPAAAPTITTDCGHLVAPWVALYQTSHFGGRELCFEGKGLINLADYGFDKQTDSINIAANGSFYDQAGGQGASLGFFYGDEQADLGTWDNRISSFVVTG